MLGNENFLDHLTWNLDQVETTYASLLPAEIEKTLNYDSTSALTQEKVTQIMTPPALYFCHTKFTQNLS